MKKITALVLATTTTLAPLVIIAQDVRFRASAEKVTEGGCVLHKYTAAWRKGTIYINCLSSPRIVREGVLVLERSFDGIHYNVLTFRSTAYSPFELLYSFSDTRPVAGKTWYRIRYAGAESDRLHNEVIAVEMYPDVQIRAAVR